MIKIYYGLSGTLKSSTIKQKYEEGDKKPVIIRSAIKNWKYNRDALFPWLCNESNLNYALLHLTRLQDYVYGDYDFIIERGVTDPLYYEYQKQPELITPSIISSAVEKESEILCKNKIHKTLMIVVKYLRNMLIPYHHYNFYFLTIHILNLFLNHLEPLY